METGLSDVIQRPDQSESDTNLTAPSHGLAGANFGPRRAGNART